MALEMIDNFLELLRAKHGKDLDLENDVYFLFLKGGLFTLYFDEDDKELKISIEMLPHDKTFIYHSDIDLVELGWEKEEET